jgi:hypothetical protein
MATDLEPSRATPLTKYETFVTTQLALAERRIRLLDLTTALLGLLAGTTIYALLMAIGDRWLSFSDATRQLAFAVYLVGAAVYLALMVVRPLRRQVNPYYAARRVEQTLPGAKNSVVNWLDLHQAEVPTAIRGALGQRAAKDLSRADLEQAISSRQAKRSGLVAGALAGLMLVLIFVYGPGPFFFRLGRVFAPFFINGQAPTRTQLTLLQPPGGDATVTVGRPITFVVQVDGKVPDPKKADALKLLLRYQDEEPYQERLLVPDSGSEWSVTVPAIDVQSGFWYRISGGDAITPEYRIRVRSTPLITDFLATYQPPAYTARTEVVRRERKLEGLYGTKVNLRVRTNRPLQEAALLFDGKEGREKVRGERLADEPNGFRVVLPLEQAGQYRLQFTAADGEIFTDSLAYPVVVFPDLPPKVELTKPGKDSQLPANGVLQVEGQASDDIGVKSLTLQMRLLAGIRLQPKHYRSDDKLQLPHGGYPLFLAYKDFVELAKLKDADGKPVRLETGDILEYWLEAADACDLPAPHVSESKHFRVQIMAANQDDQQQQQEAQQAQQEQQQHEKSQDQQLQQEDKERQDAADQQRQQNQEEAAKDQQPQDGSGSNVGDKNQNQGSEKKDGAGDKSGTGKDDKNQNQHTGQNQQPQAGDKTSNSGDVEQPKPDAEQQKKDEQVKEQAKRLQEAINKAAQQKAGGEKAEAKGDPKPGDGTGKGEGQPQAAPQPGESKPEGKPGAGKEAADGKEGPKPGDKQEKPAQGKGESTPNPQQEKGEGKAADPMKEKADGKGEGASSQPPKPAEAKDSGSPNAQKEAGASKPEGSSTSREQPAKAEAKDAGPEGKPADGQPAGAKKDQPQPTEKSEGKGAGDNIASKEAPAAPKNDQSGDPGQRAEAKPDSAKNGKGDARAEAKPADKPTPTAGQQGDKIKAGDATPSDAERIAKDLQSQDARQREAAAKQLEDMKDHARDPATRETARRELDKHGRPTDEGKRAEGQPNTPTQGKSEGKQPEKTTTAKEGAGEKKQDTGTTKGRDPKTEGKTADAKDAGKQEGKSADTKDTGSEAIKTPTGRRNSDEGPDGVEPAVQNAKPADHRAGVIQLEDIRKKVNKDVLKAANMTEEEYREWEKAARALNQRLQTQTKTPETPAAPQTGSGLSTTGGKRIDPGAKGQPGDVRSGGIVLPPEDYREGWREFTMRKKKATDSKDKP